MAREPTDLVLDLLRDIRAKLDERDRRFDEHDRQFEALNKKIDDWQETTATAVGLATHANLRNARVEERSPTWRGDWRRSRAPNETAEGVDLVGGM